MPGRGARRRLRIGRRVVAKVTGGPGGVPSGRGLGCPAVSAAPWPARVCGGRGRPPRAPWPRVPPPLGTRRPPPPSPPPGAAAAGCERRFSGPAGAMGCGNSTATSAGAGPGERGGQPGAWGRRRGRWWGVRRAGHLGSRGQEKGGGEPGREGMHPLCLPPVFGTGADRPRLEPLNAGHVPRAGAVTPGRGEPAGRSCGGTAGRTGGGVPCGGVPCGGWAGHSPGGEGS